MMSAQQKQIIPALVAALFLSIGITNASNIIQRGIDTKKDKSCVSVTTNIVIKARPELVWLSIEEARTSDPSLSSCKVLIEGDHSSTIRETFAIPLLGEATCTLSLLELPLSRISYTLMESDTFKTFEGSWLLVPSPGSHSTRLSLSCNSDMKNPVPQMLLRMITGKKIGKRLDFVKSLAEKKETQMQKTEKLAIAKVIAHS
jgi:hypothetical protein